MEHFILIKSVSIYQKLRKYIVICTVTYPDFYCTLIVFPIKKMRIFGASCQFEGLYTFISSDAEQKMTNLNNSSQKLTKHLIKKQITTHDIIKENCIQNICVSLRDFNKICQISLIMLTFGFLMTKLISQQSKNG